jgi:hypothetical protein
LDICPKRSDFKQRLQEAQDQSGSSTNLLRFVAALQAKYPDLTESDDTPWATGPLTGEISDNFINFAVSWSWYNEDLISFVVETARSHGLHCFDPQSNEFYETKSGR